MYYTTVHYLLAVECAQYLPNAVLNRARQGKLRTPARARKHKECVHALKSCICVLTSLPEGSEHEYNKKVGQIGRKLSDLKWWTVKKWLYNSIVYICVFKRDFDIYICVFKREDHRSPL